MKINCLIISRIGITEWNTTIKNIFSPVSLTHLGFSGQTLLVYIHALLASLW
jgi:hypothetical protein